MLYMELKSMDLIVVCCMCNITRCGVVSLFINCSDYHDTQTIYVVGFVWIDYYTLRFRQWNSFAFLMFVAKIERECECFATDVCTAHTCTYSWEVRFNKWTSWIRRVFFFNFPPIWKGVWFMKNGFVKMISFFDIFDTVHDECMRSEVPIEFSNLIQYTSFVESQPRSFHGWNLVSVLSIQRKRWFFIQILIWFSLTLKIACGELNAAKSCWCVDLWFVVSKRTHLLHLRWKEDRIPRGKPLT